MPVDATFPTVTELYLDCSHGKEGTRAMTETLKKFPNLVTLHLGFRKTDENDKKVCGKKSSSGSRKCATEDDTEWFPQKRAKSSPNVCKDEDDIPISQLQAAFRQSPANPETTPGSRRQSMSRPHPPPFPF